MTKLRSESIRLELHAATDEEIARANEVRTTRARYSPAEEELERLHARECPQLQTMVAWLSHPDERVAAALLDNPLPFRNRKKHDEWLREFSHIARKRVERLVADGIAWSPLIDKLSTRGSVVTERADPLLRQVLAQDVPDTDEALHLLKCFPSHAFEAHLLSSLPEDHPGLECILDNVRDPCGVLHPERDHDPRFLRRLEDHAISRLLLDHEVAGAPQPDRNADVRALWLLTDVQDRYQSLGLEMDPGNLERLVTEAASLSPGEDSSYVQVRAQTGLQKCANSLAPHDLDRLLPTVADSDRLDGVIASHPHLDGSRATAFLEVLMPKAPARRLLAVLSQMSERIRRSPGVQDLLLRQAPPSVLVQCLGDFRREVHATVVARLMSELGALDREQRSMLFDMLAKHHFDIRKEHLLALVRHGTFNDTLLRMATHPEADEEVWTAMLGARTDHRFRLSLASQPRPLSSSAVVNRLAKSTSGELLVTMLEHVTAKHRPQIFRQLARSDASRALSVLEEGSGVVSSLSPADVAPLFRSSNDASVRKRALALLGQLPTQPREGEHASSRTRTL